MVKNRTGPWLTLLLVAAALLLGGIPGIWMYVKTTATTLHPNPKDAPSVSRSAPSPRWAAAVEQARQAVRASLSGQNLPGLSVAVGVGGEIVWAEGFGLADLDSALPVAPSHRFRIGTASTVLTSAAAGLLLEQRRLKLDEKIQTYVPAFPEKQWPITLEQLMAHRSGLTNDGGDEGPLFAKSCAHPAEALPEFAGNDLQFEPGTRYRYSRYGWILVSAAIESAARQPLLAFMQERVFDPIGMRDTLADSASPPPENRATPYFPRFMADPAYGLHLMRDLDLSCYSGAGAFLSTPSDLVRFGMAINNGKLLQPATVRLLQTSQRLPSGAETGYGLGWDLKTVTLAGKPTPAAGHDGDLLGGMVASLMTFPNHGIAVAVASNISYADTFNLAATIADGFAGQANPLTDK